MPIVMIHAFEPADPTVVPKLIVDVRDAGAVALTCARSNIWVMFLPMARGAYVQGEGAPRTEHGATEHAPVVIVKAQFGRSDVERERLVRAVAGVVGGALTVPVDNVWIHYEQMRPQDVWFGSKWAG